MRLVAGVEYDGSFYCGWQRQAQGISIQACLEEALSRVANHPVSIICAGRTDAGVHAMQQIFHFDSYALRTPRAWVLGANTYLPASIRVLWAKPTSEQFHARHVAIRRTYRYVIYSHPVSSALLYRKVTWIPRRLDLKKMQQGANYLLGTHDFSSFRAKDCQAKHAVRTVFSLALTEKGCFTYLDIEANGFLHHMVRNIAGVLMAVGSGKKSPHWVEDVLQARDRKKGGVTAGPQGLYFMGATYPDEFKLPAANPILQGF